MTRIGLHSGVANEVMRLVLVRSGWLSCVFLQDVGITKEQLETIRTQVTPGSSALFVVTDQGNLDLVGERFRLPHSKLIASNLTDAERQVLLETFGNR